MAGRKGSRGDRGLSRDEERLREREARERARQRRLEKNDERTLEARAREREESILRIAAAERQAEETRAAAARWRAAEAARAAVEAPASPAEPAGDGPLATRADPPGSVASQPGYAAPLTRAGRERQAVFAPAQPAPRRAERESRPGAKGGGRRREAKRATAAVAPEGDARPRDRNRSAGADGPLAVALAGAGTAAALVRDRPRGALAALATVLVALGAASLLGGGGEERTATKSSAAADTAAARKAAWAKSPYGVPTEVALPPKTRVVAYTGAPQAKELGILGTMPFEQASDRLDRQAVPYDRKSRPVLRAFDLIATIADAHPGPAGKFRTRQTSAVIARYLRAARRHDAMLILDVQPGGSNFIDELRPLERWLKEPDVALALDPEWRMRPGVQPGSEIGYVSAGEVTATLERVAELVREHGLPPKLVLVHRFTDGMIRDLESVRVPKEVVGVISIDGVGNRSSKIATYDRIAPTLPEPWLPGFKLFYQEDEAAGGMMYGEQVMNLRPRPHVVLYE